MRIDLRGAGRRFPLPDHPGEWVEALQPLDLLVGSGERLGIEGSSGSGKSTMVSLLAGLAPPSSGEVLWNGRAIHRGRRPPTLDPAQVGISFQETPFVPEIDAAENLRLVGAFARGQVAEQRIEDLLERFGLADRFDLHPNSLSGGERRRLSVARALLLEPRLIVLDEPTSDLDPRWAERLWDCVMEQAERTGATLIVASHERDRLVGVERWVRLEAGRLVPESGR